MNEHRVKNAGTVARGEANADDANEDVLKLARVAIFCSAFGAAILLAVAMCVLNGAASPPPKALQNLIQVNVFVEQPSPGSDPVRINLLIRPPGKAQMELDLDKLERNGGLVSELSSDGDVRAIGLTFRNDMITAPSAVGWAGRLIIQPKKIGQWKFAARWVNGGVTDGDDSVPVPSDNVKIRIVITDNLTEQIVDQPLTLEISKVSSTEVFSPE